MQSRALESTAWCAVRMGGDLLTWGYLEGLSSQQRKWRWSGSQGRRALISSKLTTWYWKILLVHEGNDGWSTRSIEKLVSPMCLAHMGSPSDSSDYWKMELFIWLVCNAQIPNWLKDDPSWSNYIWSPKIEGVRFVFFVVQEFTFWMVGIVGERRSCTTGFTLKDPPDVVQGCAPCIVDIMRSTAFVSSL